MPTEEALNTIVGKGAFVEGKVKIDGAGRVDGRVKGSVESTDTLTVGVTGAIEGAISCKAAIVGGVIEGNIAASSRTELQAKCRVVGDIKTKVIIIEEGAFFQGSCSMTDAVPVKKVEK
jgi:cytoskeletal protein CcmA (bactofilin family)